jgi:DNA-binding transcriptional regulator GbsR (MarR family)
MIETLKSIGLTNGEAKVYLAILKLGSSKVGPIVNESGISYSKIYEVLGRLIDKGLASYIIKQRTKYFSVIEPQGLINFIDRKEKEISDNKKKVVELIPKLTKLKDNKENQTSEIFLGIEGLRTAYEKLTEDTKKNDELMFFYIHDEKYFEKADLFYQQEFYKFNKKGLQVMGISTRKFKKSKYFTKPPKFIKLKFVNFPLPSIIDICNDQVLITTWAEKPFANLIHSKEVADNFREYFNSIWKIAIN